MKDYNETINKIRDWKEKAFKNPKITSKIEKRSKEIRLENHLKKFEDKYFIPISMIFTRDGFIISTGIEPENKWLNVDIVGAYGAQFMSFVETFIEEVLAKPHVDPKSKIMEHVGDIKRNIKILTNMVETEVEGQPLGILFSPIESVGFYLAIITNPALRNMQLLQKIKEDLPYLLNLIKKEFD